MSNPDTGLDVPLEQFREQLHEAVDMLIGHYAGLPGAKAYAGVAEDVVRGWFDEGLPETGMAFDALLAAVRETVVEPSTRNIAPKMFAYVMSGGNQVSVIGDLIASALDQNVAKWHLAPSMTEIERRIIQWAADFIGLGKPVGGAIVSGGSAANLTGLTVARNLFLEHDGVREHGLFDFPALRVYASSETHSSVTKSIELLGIGSANFRRIPVGTDYTIETDALRAAIAEDRAAGLRPFCIIGNAGTVNTGAIDPLDALARIAREAGTWFHVDGCYGGLAASLAGRAQRYAGLAGADSIALDFHKWLYQPFEIGCTLVGTWGAMRRTFHTSADYLDTDKHGGSRFDITDHHFDLSRNAKALKVWMSFKAYGAGRFREMIAKDIALTEYLCDSVRAADDFELVAAGSLAIACFRYTGPGPREAALVDRLNESLIPALERDGRVFITGTKLGGRPVIRSCIINHRARRTDVDYLLDVIREVARGLDA